MSTTGFGSGTAPFPPSSATTGGTSMPAAAPLSLLPVPVLSNPRRFTEYGHAPSAAARHRSPLRRSQMDEDDNHHAPYPSRSVRMARADESIKWKKEAEKWQDQYERQMMAHKRDLALLEEKLVKVDGALQNALKEKNHVQACLIAREKEIAELQHREHALKSNLAKSDKSSILFHDKAKGALALEKRVTDLQKATGRIRSVADKKTTAVDRLTREREELESLVDSLRHQMEELSVQNAHCVEEVQRAHQARTELEGHVMELQGMLQQTNFLSESKYMEQLQRTSKSRNDPAPRKIRPGGSPRVGRANAHCGKRGE
ncbi:hypothetical protein DFJ73DRAFT_222099 [Zopfochytrium polystomum]|nr:hypothetical protein DFJ73DRAFT_222099 [Zopfochytrium polystomum]